MGLGEDWTRSTRRARARTGTAGQLLSSHQRVAQHASGSTQECLSHFAVSPLRTIIIFGDSD